MIDLRDYQRKVELLNCRMNLSNLCGCQLKEFSHQISAIAPSSRESLLALIYLESLLQGLVYSHDPYNYWDYIEVIGGKQLAMSYHGAEIQFRLMLLIPLHDSSFDKSVLSNEVQKHGCNLLPKWLGVYKERFGMIATRRLLNGIQFDSDVIRLINEFPFLRKPLETTFGLMESA